MADDDAPNVPDLIGYLGELAKSKDFVNGVIYMIVIVWLVCAAAAIVLGPQRTGPFGDSFGAMSCLFSGAAMLGAFFAVSLQRQELDQTRKDSKDAEEGRRKDDRYAFLSASLNAATSLASAYSEVISMTRESAMADRSPGRSRDPQAEKLFMRYRQLQEILLFEVQNVDAFHAEGRAPLTLKTKKEYLANLVRSVQPEWDLLLHQYLGAASRPEGLGRDIQRGSVLDAAGLLRFVAGEAETFCTQAGVPSAAFSTTLASNARNIREFLHQNDVRQDWENRGAVAAFFARGHQLIHNLDVSMLPD
jgi:hypothetical protein